ncbi:MAG: allantoinase AllB [Candidatus Aminicenantes bacterium]|nr:MAG: allantoinase AllB [Candidatus Aminicenantes bacterium]
MPSRSLKILSNVFTSTVGNQVQLVDVLFDEQINKILPRLHRTVSWIEISSRDKWKRFQEQISLLAPRQYSNDSTIYDGRFRLLIPGAIDTHVHFNTPGFEDREDFEHGSLAAASGGVTTVVDMPCTSIPPVTSLENLHAKLIAINGRSWVDYAFWGGISGNDFKDGKDIQQQIRELTEEGVVGFKAYLISGMKTFTDLTPDQMLQAAHWIKAISTGRPLAVHAEDKKLVEERRAILQKKNVNDWQAYCQARDVQAEAKAVETMIDIARKSKCWIHIVHLSSKTGLKLIRRAREEGLDVTAETCPHYLHFTRDDFKNPKISAFLKTAPPVKSESDQDALWKGLKDGTISFVTTDHAGCDPKKEKISNNFWQVYGGIPGVEHFVPFMFSEGFKKERLTLERTIDLISTNPARFCGISKKKGTLEPGKDADMALVNLWDRQVIKGIDMHSKGKYTPFEGVCFGAKVEDTFLRGIHERERHTHDGAFVLRFI